MFVVRVSVPFASLRRQVVCCLPQVRCLFGEGLAIGSKTGTEACFVKKSSAGMPELLEGAELAKNLMVPVLR